MLGEGEEGEGETGSSGECIVSGGVTALNLGGTRGLGEAKIGLWDNGVAVGTRLREAEGNLVSSACEGVESESDFVGGESVSVVGKLLDGGVSDSSDFDEGVSVLANLFTLFLDFRGVVFADLVVGGMEDEGEGEFVVRAFLM